MVRCVPSCSAGMQLLNDEMSLIITTQTVFTVNTLSLIEEHQSDNDSDTPPNPKSQRTQDQ